MAGIKKNSKQLSFREKTEKKKKCKQVSLLVLTGSRVFTPFSKERKPVELHGRFA